MEGLYELTDQQLEMKNDMIETANRIGHCFMDAKYRGIGKSTILRDIGLEYQALNYTVFIITQSYMKQEYIANQKLTPLDNGRWLPDESVVLVDEMYLDDTVWAIEYCNKRGIPIMGFARYRK